jgi:hypothetical protein
MIKRLCGISITLLIAITAFSQEVPNAAGSTALSPSSAAGSLAASTEVNYFTGIPSVSVPLYSYSGPGMNVSMSADYNGGGAKVGEDPSIIGLGWYLNAGGLITRTVRGLPDDIPTYGFMNAAAIPVDFRSSGDKYYYDTIDAQPDIFQFNVNGRAGEFYIGKNKQIVVVPQSQLKITYTTDASSHLINSFTIIAENGTKYIFNVTESTTQTVNNGNTYYKSAYSGTFHYSAWYLSQIIAPLNTDTIQFSYYTRYLNTSFAYPSVSIVDATTHAQTAFYSPTGNNASTITKLASITFPNKTQVKFHYSNIYQYDDTDFALAKLEIWDSVLRKGFQFDYQKTYSGYVLKWDASQGKDVLTQTTYPTNLILLSITPYTATQISKGYSFLYNALYPNFHTYSGRDSVLNAYDYWGYFNGWSNRTDAIPFISGVNTSGANRTPSASRITENALSTIILPSGGIVHYDYEPNTVRSDSLLPQNISMNVNSSGTITLSQLFSNVHELNLTPNNVDRTASAPFTGTCNLVLNIKNTAGTVLYATTTISLYDLFYLGLKKWSFTVPGNGSYKIESSLSGGGTVPGGYLTQITWNNQVAGSSTAYSGGIRVSKITTQTASDDTTHNIYQQFNYNTSDGNSSGFLGEVPQYYYPYQEKITSPSTTKNLNIVSSDPVNNISTAQGSIVGYSHVEVYKGTSTKNLGKTVYEFTTLADVGANYFHATFPYGPQDIKDWGLGLPKRILVYDSSGNLIKSTTNQFSFSSTVYNTTDFKGLKLGMTSTTYLNDPATYPTTARSNLYIGQEYYISIGRPSLDKVVDSVFNHNGTIQIDSVSYTYDSYYNLTKATATYDKTRGLSLETRLYYPYNYTLSSGAIKTLKDSSIITQVVSTEKWITGDANPRIVDASIADFYQGSSKKYIMPQHFYKLQSNAPVSQTTIGSFSSSSLVRNTTYFVEQGSVPVFYGNGTPAQQTNALSGENSCVILDYDSLYVVAKVSNAALSDVAYTSFESDGSGNWTIASSVRDKTAAITGKQSYNLSNGNVSVNINSSQRYILTGWIYSGAVVYVDGSNISAITSPIASHNNWYLYSYALPAVSNVTLSGSGLVDELRLYPKDANMITYTYEPNVGVTSTCDANNTIIYTEYDNLNRAKLIRDVDKNILKRFDYSDNNTIISTTPNWVATGTYCIPNQYAQYDSVFTDQNVNSDTYHDTIRIYKGYNYCLCTTDPSYKVVNGTCEQGTRVVTGSYHEFVPDSNGVKHWQWRCVYHYLWSDSSVSQDYTEIHPDSPTSPCDLINP